MASDDLCVDRYGDRCYFAYPSLHIESDVEGCVLDLQLLAMALMPIYLGDFIPWFAKNKRSWTLEHERC